MGRLLVLPLLVSHGCADFEALLLSRCCFCYVPALSQAMIRGSGPSLDEWRVDRVWFNFKWYKSVKELLTAWRAPNSAVKSTFKWREPSKRAGVSMEGRLHCRRRQQGCKG